MDKVSIIVPVYNSERYLNECIDSLLNQDYNNIEIIIVDDGSKDKSNDIIKQYQDNRIRFFSKKNGGVSSARNYGIRKSTGKYVCFCDSDDFLEKNYVSKMVSNFTNNNSLVIGKYRKIEESGVEIYNNCVGYNCLIDLSKKNGSLIYTLLYNNAIQAVYCKLFDLKIIKNNDIYFDEDMCFGEDTKFVLKYLEYVKSIYTFDDIIYNYRSNPESITNSVSIKQVDSMLKSKIALKDFIDFFDFNNTQIEDYYYLSTLIDYYYFNISGFDNSDYRKYYLRLKNNTFIKKCKRKKSLVKNVKQYIPITFDFMFLWFIMCKFRKFLIIIKK